MSLVASQPGTGASVGAEFLPVTQVLGSITDELRNLADSVAAMEQLVSTLMAEGILKQSLASFELQELDHIRQRIDGVATITNNLSETLPHFPVACETVTRLVMLSDLSARMLGKSPVSSGQIIETDDNTDFFDEVA